VYSFVAGQAKWKSRLNLWSIWLNLPAGYSKQIDHVSYKFLDKTFKHPIEANLGSNIFLAQWRGYGCVDKAVLTATLTNGDVVHADFDFCAVAKDSLPQEQ
jgi:hypothetical protein